jgi:hypothetical protein
LVEEAISPMGRLEVFEAKMVLAGAKLSYSLKKKRKTMYFAGCKVGYNTQHRNQIQTVTILRTWVQFF